MPMIDMLMMFQMMVELLMLFKWTENEACVQVPC